MMQSPPLTLAEWRAQHRAGRPLKILVDPELRQFVDELLKTDTFEEIARRCLERFGRPRAPSVSAIGRYWHYVQGHQAAAASNCPDIAPGGPVHGRAGECLWCRARLTSAAQRPAKRFCGDICRTAFHSAARRWAVAAATDGRLPIEELRRFAQQEET